MLKRSQLSLEKKVARAVWFGSALEYYDFFLFGSAAVLFLGPLYFPSSNPEVAQLAALASVGAGFFARPFGALILGHLGDVYGRRLVLCFTLILMGMTSVMIGLLPTYDEIGMVAPVSLLGLRLLQGFAISGAHASASALALELSAEDKRGLYASFALSGTQLGFIMACSAFLILPLVMAEAELSRWGWRIPFLLSFFLAAMGIWARLCLPESPAFLSKHGPIEKGFFPIRILWSQYRVNVLRVVLAAQISVVSTIFGVYSLSWAINYTQIGRGNMLAVLVSNAVVGMLVIPMWADLSDRIGRRQVFIFGALGSGVLIWPYFWSLAQSSVPLTFFFGVLLSGVVYSAANGVWPSLYAEMFSTKVRISGMAIGTQVGFMLAAQSSPLAAFLTRNAPSEWTPVAFLVSFSCGVSALAVYCSRETHRSALADLGQQL